jgi:hypothetical protein
MRVEVARTIVATLKAMNPQFPDVDEDELAKFDEMREQLSHE